MDERQEVTKLMNLMQNIDSKSFYICELILTSQKCLMEKKKVSKEHLEKIHNHLREVEVMQYDLRERIEEYKQNGDMDN